MNVESELVYERLPMVKSSKKAILKKWTNPSQDYEIYGKDICIRNTDPIELRKKLEKPMAWTAVPNVEPDCGVPVRKMQRIDKASEGTIPNHLSGHFRRSAGIQKCCRLSATNRDANRNIYRQKPNRTFSL